MNPIGEELTDNLVCGFRTEHSEGGRIKIPEQSIGLNENAYGCALDNLPETFLALAPRLFLRLCSVISRRNTIEPSRPSKVNRLAFASTSNTVPSRRSNRCSIAGTRLVLLLTLGYVRSRLRGHPGEFFRSPNYQQARSQPPHRTWPWRQG